VVEGDERDLAHHARPADLLGHPRLDAALGVVRHRLGLDLHEDPGSAAQEAQGLGECRDALAGVGRPEPVGVAGGHRPDLGQGHPAHVASAGGGAVEGGVVEDDHVAVSVS